jgi:hypothetical protein
MPAPQERYLAALTTPRWAGALIRAHKKAMDRAARGMKDMRLGSLQRRQGPGSPRPAVGGSATTEGLGGAPLDDGGRTGKGSPAFQGASVLTYLWEDKGLSQARVASVDQGLFLSSGSHGLASSPHAL